MIREEQFVLSRGQFAIDLASLRVVADDDSPSAWCCVQAVWYRRKGGVLRACLGNLHEPMDPPPADAADFLARYDHDAWGGHCEGRWDGKRYWGAQEPEVIDRHLAVLRPMLDGFPVIPEGHDGWWRFLTTAELRKKRGLHHLSIASIQLFLLMSSLQGNDSEGEKMGSFDRQPDDWNEFADAAWAPRHVIRCNSKWGGQERHDHQAAAEVRECYRAARDEAAGTPVWQCGWLLEGRYDDGSRYTFPCEAPARYTPERGEGTYACEHGHDFIPAQLRQAEGWDYAGDEGEVALLRQYGVQAVAMNGGAI